MAAPPLIWREPQVFAAGDSLVFQRSLGAYLPSDGWSILLTLTQPTPQGGKQITQITSVPDSTNKFHTFNVPNWLAGQAPGGYEFTEQVVCSAGGGAPSQTQTIYYGELELDPDYAAGGVPGAVLPWSQQMVTLLEAKLLRLESFDLTETDVQRSRLIVEDRNKTYDRLKWLRELLGHEKKQETQRNTGQNQIAIQPIFGGGW